MNPLQMMMQDPEFQALAVKDQISAARMVAKSMMLTDPEFQALAPSAQDEAVNQVAISAPTFDNPTFGDAIKKNAQDVISGNGGGFNRAMTEFGLGIVRGSGIASLAVMASGAGKDIGRAYDYYKEIDQLAGGGSARTIGEVLGFVGDIVGIGKVTAPLTAAVAKGGEIALAGGRAVAEAAAAAGEIAPRIHPALALLNGVAADTLVTALPFYLSDEAKRSVAGEPTLSSQSAGEIATEFGLNAAANFVIGSAAGALLAGGGRVLKGLAKRNLANVDIAPADLEEKMVAWAREPDPTLLEGLPEWTQDRVKQGGNVARWVLDGGIVKDADNVISRDQYLANDLGMTLGEHPSPEGMKYKVWELDEANNPVARNYANLNEAENFMAYRYYQQAAKWSESDPSKINPAHIWAMKRGEVLFQNESLLKGDTWAKMDPELQSFFKVQGKVAQAAERPVISRGEADAVASLPGTTVIQAQVPLKGAIVTAVKDGEFDLLRGVSVAHVAKSDTPNMAFFGVRTADDNIYAVAVKKADEISARFPSISPEDAKASILLNQGFDHYLLPDGSAEFFTPRNARFIGAVEDVVRAVPKFKVAGGPVNSTVVIQGVARAKAFGPDFTGNPDLVLSAATSALRNGTTEDLSNFSKAYLAGYGKATDLKITRIQDLPAVQLIRRGESFEIRVPASLRDFDTEQKVTKDLFNALKKVSGEGSKAPVGSYWASRIAKNPGRFELPSGVDQLSWVEKVVDDLGGAIERKSSGAVDLLMPSGLRSFGDLPSAVDFLSKRLVDPAALGADLRVTRGLDLLQAKDGSWAVFDIRSKSKVPVSRAPDIPTLMENLKYQPDYVSLRYGPKEVRIEADGISFDLTKNVKYSDLSAAMKSLAKFKDTEWLAKQKFQHLGKNGTIAISPDSTFRVYLSKYDYIAHFDSFAEARSFLEKDAKSFSEFFDMADKKMLDLQIRDGRYKVTAQDGVIHYANNADDLGAVFKGYPDIEESVPKLLDALDPAVEHDVRDLVDGWKTGRKYRAGINPHNVPPGVGDFGNQMISDARRGIMALTAQTDAWVESWVRQTGRKDFMSDIWIPFKHARRILAMEESRATKLLGAIFTDNGGKALPEASQQKVFYYLAQENEKATAALSVQYKATFKSELSELKLSETELTAASRLHNFFNEYALKFGFSYEDLIFKYMPLLRDLKDASNKDLVNNLTLAPDLVRTMFNDKPPPSLKFAAENERTGDLFELMQNGTRVRDNALEVSSIYINQGLKKFYLGEPWKKMYNYIQAMETKDPVLTQRMNMFREQLMGMYRTPAERVVEDVGIKLMRNLKSGPLGNTLLKGMTLREAEEFGSNIPRGLLTMTYFTQLGLKPWNAIRQTLQPMVTLAPRFGLAETIRAMDHISRVKPEYFQYLRDHAVISDKLPIIDDILGRSTKAGKLAEKSMSMFKNGDEYGRAVAYYLGESRFGEADKALRLGAFKGDEAAIQAQFFKLSGLDIIEPNMAQKIWQTYRVPGPRGQDFATGVAKDLYGMHIVSQTMFPMESGQASLLRSGLIGKIFGQYGSFPEAYRANLFAMVRYGTPAQRIAMVSTYLGITTALWATFSALRIKTNDFIPVSPAIFAGGPWANTIMDTLTAVGSAQGVINGAPPGMAKGDAKTVLRDLSGMVPFGYQARYLKKGIDLMETDPYGAFLSLTGVPSWPLQ